MRCSNIIDDHHYFSITLRLPLAHIYIYIYRKTTRMNRRQLGKTPTGNGDDDDAPEGMVWGTIWKLSVVLYCVVGL